MFCVKCGSKIPDGAAFCTNCGWKVEHSDISTSNKEKTVSTENNEQVKAPTSSETLKETDLNPIRKRIFSSNLALAGLIIMTAAVVLSPFAFRAGCLIFAIPEIVAMIGFWGIYLSARDVKSATLELKGLAISEKALLVQAVVTVVCGIASPFVFPSGGIGAVGGIVLLGGLLCFLRWYSNRTNKWMFKGGEIPQNFQTSRAANFMTSGAKGLYRYEMNKRTTAVDTTAIMYTLFGGIVALVGVLLFFADGGFSLSALPVAAGVALIGVAYVIYGIVVIKYRFAVAALSDSTETEDKLSERREEDK